MKKSEMRKSDALEINKLKGLMSGSASSIAEQYGVLQEEESISNYANYKKLFSTSPKKNQQQPNIEEDAAPGASKYTPTPN